MNGEKRTESSLSLSVKTQGLKDICLEHIENTLNIVKRKKKKKKNRILFTHAVDVLILKPIFSDFYQKIYQFILKKFPFFSESMYLVAIFCTIRFGAGYLAF